MDPLISIILAGANIQLPVPSKVWDWCSFSGRGMGGGGGAGEPPRCTTGGQHNMGSGCAYGDNKSQFLDNITIEQEIHTWTT